jgi:monovalent cation:proton antiporter-2 (CPA2) family protein
MAIGTENGFLAEAAIYLGATAIAVPIFKRLRLGSVLGFLAAGILLGPSGLKLLDAGEDVFHVAELGVVLFLFIIGLELSFPRLWSLRQTIFGLGLLQMAVTGILFGIGFEISGLLPRGPALIAGFALACSSTAFALTLLQERRELNTAYGSRAFSVLLFQDLAVIPLLAAIPLVAAMQSGDGEALAVDWGAILGGAGGIVAIIVIGKYVLNYFFKMVAISGSREAFTAAALLVVAGTALLMSEVGLSMALGGFLAGVVLAESAFRHQIEADIEPYRELLLGLFFIGVGMQLDLDVVFSAWWVVLAGAGALIFIKMAILYGLARAFGSGRDNAIKTAAILSQGGEFAFVVFSLGIQRELFDPQLATLLSAIVTLSMVATPLIIMLANRLGREASESEDVAMPEAEEPRGRVLIVGYGRMGQLVDQVLRASGVEVTAIDNDPRRIALAARFGNKVYFGDGMDPHLLLQAGAVGADAVVFTINARDRVGKAISSLRASCPNVRILARVYDRMAEIELMDVETDFVVRELFESSLVMAQKTLTFLGFSDALIADISAEYRERDRSRLLAQKAEGIYAKKDVLQKPFEAVTHD